jgi:hypothetical protein
VMSRYSNVCLHLFNILHLFRWYALSFFHASMHPRELCSLSSEIWFARRLAEWDFLVIASPAVLAHDREAIFQVGLLVAQTTRVWDVVYWGP